MSVKEVSNVHGLFHLQDVHGLHKVPYDADYSVMK